MPPNTPAHRAPTGKAGAATPATNPTAPGGGGSAGDPTSGAGAGYSQDVPGVLPATGGQNQGQGEGDYGILGTLQPADVFQLAVWALVPANDDEELATRRAEVREIIMGLLDEIAPDDGSGEGRSRKARPRR